MSDGNTFWVRVPGLAIQSPELSDEHFNFFLIVVIIMIIVLVMISSFSSLSGLFGPPSPPLRQLVADSRCSGRVAKLGGG